MKMKKSKVMSLVVLSGLLLQASAAVLADDTTVIGNEATPAVTTEATSGIVSNVTETQPEVTAPTVTPPKDNTVIGGQETPAVTTETTSGIVSEAPSVTEATEATTTPAETKVQEPVEKPTSAQTKGTVEVNPLETPVKTSTGFKIVDTQNGLALVETESGQRELKTPTEIGATVRQDGKLEVKDDQNQVKVLPSTGENSGIVSIVGGLLVILAVVAYRFKEDILKRISKKRKEGHE